MSKIVHVSFAYTMFKQLHENSYIYYQMVFSNAEFPKNGTTEFRLVLFTFWNYQCPVGLVAERSRSHCRHYEVLGE